MIETNGSKRQRRRRANLPVVVRNMPRSMAKSLSAAQSLRRARDNILCHMKFWREHSKTVDIAFEQLSFVSSTTLG
jgi:hypothetical protein